MSGIVSFILALGIGFSGSGSGRVWVRVQGMKVDESLFVQAGWSDVFSGKVAVGFGGK